MSSDAMMDKVDYEKNSQTNVICCWPFPLWWVSAWGYWTRPAGPSTSPWRWSSRWRTPAPTSGTRPSPEIRAELTGVLHASLNDFTSEQCQGAIAGQALKFWTNQSNFNVVWLANIFMRAAWGCAKSIYTYIFTLLKYMNFKNNPDEISCI